MDTKKPGWLSKVINVVFFKIKWYVYVGLLVAVPIAGALLGLIPNEVVAVLSRMVAGFVLTYVIVALLLQIIMKASGAEDYVDLAYTLFYRRSYLLFIAIFFIAAFAFGFVFNYVQGAIPHDFFGLVCFMLLFGLMLTFFLMIFYGLFAIPIKFILRRLGWCPSCGKFFGLKTTSREVVDTQTISVKKAVDRRNSRGEVIGQDDQYIPGTREIVEKVKTCKYCGSTLTSVKARDYANV